MQKEMSKLNRKMKVRLLNITQEISKRVAVLLLVGMILVGSTPLDPIFAMLGIEVNSEEIEQIGGGNLSI